MKMNHFKMALVVIAVGFLSAGCSSSRMSGPSGAAPRRGEAPAPEEATVERLNQDVVFLKRSVAGIREGQMNAMSELSKAVSRLEKMEATLELLSSEVEGIKQTVAVSGVAEGKAGEEVLFREEKKPEAETERAEAETPGTEVESLKPEVQAAVDPQKLYDEAYRVFQQGELSRAADMFRGFVSSFPSHPLADNAQYWLGETYYARKAYLQSLDEFQKVERDFPEGNKVPDAMLKVGLSYYNLKEWNLARAKLMSLMEKYPDSDAAKIAAEEVKRFKNP